MNNKAAVMFCILLALFASTFLFPQEDVPLCYWNVSDRGAGERHPLNWIFEAPMFSDDPEDAAIQMAKYASLMGYDYIGTREYNGECGVGCHGYWASNTMYGVIDWVPSDPRTVCLRANENDEFPCFVSWRMGEERDPSTLTVEDKLRYLNGEFLSYWIDAQRDDVIDLYLAALEEQPSYGLQWDDIGIIYFDEFTSSGHAYIDGDYTLTESDIEVEFRCHECHEEGGVDDCGHDYPSVEEGRLVMEARMIELAHEHGVKVIASAGRDWFNLYLPYIYGDLPESEWPYDISLDRYRAAEPDYFVIEPDLGDPGTQEYEWSQPDYTAAEPYAQRVYAGSPRPGDPEIGIDSDKNIFTVRQVIFRVGYLASKGFWFGPNSESMEALTSDPDMGIKTAVKPFLKVIPNWENLNEVPIEDRMFDDETWVYESPITYIDDGIAYSTHPFTGDFHVVFMDEGASCELSLEWGECNVYRVNELWEREADAKDELHYEDGTLTLSNTISANAGYVITTNTYITLEERSSGRITPELLGLLRFVPLGGMVLLMAVLTIGKARH